jgi:hypothetical protein
MIEESVIQIGLATGLTIEGQLIIQNAHSIWVVVPAGGL